MSDRPQTTIQPSDRVRVVDVPDDRVFTVERIVPPPPEAPQAGPIAFFTDGDGFWRVAALERAA